MTSKSFTKKKIKLTIVLGEGTWGEGGEDTLTIEGLRVRADIVKAGGTAIGAAQLQVYGLTLSQMNKLSTLGMIITEVRKNSLLIDAGDDNNMSRVFEGTIYEAWADFMTMPEVSFNIVAQIGLYSAIRPVAASSYNGETSAATIFEDLAKKCNPPLTFENNGVDIQVTDANLPGTAVEQIRELAQHLGIRWTIDNGTLIIWPQGSSRKTENVFVVSPDTGMRGYPSYTSQGIRVQLLFTPEIPYGATIEIKSDLSPANGKWVVQTLAYNLESEMPNGNWFMTMECGRPGYTVTR